MTIIDNDMLWRQFGAAIDSFGNALRDCPDELWEAQLWQDQPDQWVAQGFSAFWYLCYHTLFWLDLYLTGAEEGFTPPAPFDLVEMEANEALPRTYTRQELLGYLETAAAGARRRSRPCRPSKPSACAPSPGVRCPSPSSSFTTCATCRSTPPNCTSSWGSRREDPRIGWHGLDRPVGWRD